MSSFSADLSSLTNGADMFYDCSELERFYSNAKKITNGEGMFYNCSALTTFNTDLSSLTNGDRMFCKCIELKTFYNDLPSLTDGDYMFDSCTSLTSFSSDLSSLTNGRYMFYGCKLDAPSVKNIALTINKNVTGKPRFDLGVLDPNDEQVKKDIGLITYKGWDVYTNNSNATTTYTFPKYEGYTTYEEIAALPTDYLDDIVNGVWSEHLPDLEKGFYTDGDGMFTFCSTLESFNGYLSRLENGSYMF
jgi:hypothetical protein